MRLAFLNSSKKTQVDDVQLRHSMAQYRLSSISLNTRTVKTRSEFPRKHTEISQLFSRCKCEGFFFVKSALIVHNIIFTELICS